MTLSEADYDDMQDAIIALLNKYGEKNVVACVQDLIEMQMNAIPLFKLLEEGMS